jgi:hypothetical protein
METGAQPENRRAGESGNRRLTLKLALRRRLTRSGPQHAAGVVARVSSDAGDLDPFRERGERFDVAVVAGDDVSGRFCESDDEGVDGGTLMISST